MNLRRRDRRALVLFAGLGFAMLHLLVTLFGPRKADPAAAGLLPLQPVPDQRDELVVRRHQPRPGPARRRAWPWRRTSATCATGRRSDLVASLLWVVFGLVFAELTLFVYLPMLVITAGYFATGTARRSGRLRLGPLPAGRDRATCVLGVAYLGLYLPDLVEHDALVGRRSTGAGSSATPRSTRSRSAPWAAPAHWHTAWAAQFEVAPSGAVTAARPTSSWPPCVSLSAMTRDRADAGLADPAVRSWRSRPCSWPRRGCCSGPASRSTCGSSPRWPSASRWRWGWPSCPLVGRSRVLDGPRPALARRPARRPSPRRRSAYVAVRHGQRRRLPAAPPRHDSPEPWYARLREVAAPSTTARRPGRRRRSRPSSSTGRTRSTSSHWPSTTARCASPSGPGRLLRRRRRRPARPARPRGRPLGGCTGARRRAATRSHPDRTVPLDGPVLGFGWRLRIAYTAERTPRRRSPRIGDVDTADVSCSPVSTCSSWPATRSYDSVTVSGVDPASDVCVSSVTVGTTQVPGRPTP